jgi:hypothetical protein
MAKRLQKLHCPVVPPLYEGETPWTMQANKICAPTGLPSSTGVGSQTLYGPSLDWDVLGRIGWWAL